MAVSSPAVPNIHNVPQMANASFYEKLNTTLA